MSGSLCCPLLAGHCAQGLALGSRRPAPVCLTTVGNRRRNERNHVAASRHVATVASGDDSAVAAKSAPWAQPLGRAGRLVHSVLAGGALSAALALGGAVGCGGPPALAEEQTFSFPASPDPKLRAAQETLVEAYAYAKAYYLDPTMNGLDWDSELEAALAETFKVTDDEEAYAITSRLIAKLGDPFTRVLPPAEASKFLNAEKGQVNAIGMQVARELDLSGSTGGRRVTAVIAGSEAERAGVLPGDLLLTINNTSLRLLEPNEVTAMLRQPEGVDVTLLHSGGGELRAHLRAGDVEVNPVQFGLLPDNNTGGVGYIRLAVFSENAAAKVEHAVRTLQAEGASAFILDIRDNAGGGVFPGVQTAALWLNPGDPLANVEYARQNYIERVAVQDFSKPISDAPLVVLVNGRTASVSELLAAAFHDDGRAKLIGETTFGKGRTQRVIALKSGWLLLVSTNRFTTPQQQAIDQVGVVPDIICKPKVEIQEMWRPGMQEADSLLQDPCIARAVALLSSGE